MRRRMSFARLSMNRTLDEQAREQLERMSEMSERPEGKAAASSETSVLVVRE